MGASRVTLDQAASAAAPDERTRLSPSVARRRGDDHPDKQEAAGASAAPASSRV
jgi:hypothetical protein